MGLAVDSCTGEHRKYLKLTHVTDKPKTKDDVIREHHDDVMNQWNREYREWLISWNLSSGKLVVKCRGMEDPFTLPVG